MIHARTAKTLLAGILVGGAGMGALWAADAPAPAKAYVVAEIKVTDPENYKAYVAKVTPVVASFGGTYLARGGKAVPVEGAPPAGRVVIIEFPSLDAAMAFQASPGEKEALLLRRQAATGRQFMVEGITPVK